MQKWLSKLWVMAGLCLALPSHAQTIKSNDALLLKQNFYEEKFESKRKVTFLLSRTKNPIIRYNPISLSFGGLLFAYQKFLSPQISSNCPYSPSCSAFSKKSILDYGFIKGIALSADRLMRCNSLAMKDVSFLDFKNGEIDDAPGKYSFKK